MTTILDREGKERHPLAPNQPELTAYISGAQLTLASASKHLDELLKSEVITMVTWQETAAKVGQSMTRARAQMEATNKAFGFKNAHEALITYLSRRVGQIVEGGELEGVGAITSWSRRLRELGEKFCWPIDSNVERADLYPDKYILTSRERTRPAYVSK